MLPGAGSILSLGYLLDICCFAISLHISWPLAFYLHAWYVFTRGGTAKAGRTWLFAHGAAPLTAGYERFRERHFTVFYLEQDYPRLRRCWQAPLRRVGGLAVSRTFCTVRRAGPWRTRRRRRGTRWLATTARGYAAACCSVALCALWRVLQRRLNTAARHFFSCLLPTLPPLLLPLGRGRGRGLGTQLGRICCLLPAGLSALPLLPPCTFCKTHFSPPFCHFLLLLPA